MPASAARRRHHVAERAGRASAGQRRGCWRRGCDSHLHAQRRRQGACPAACLACWRGAAACAGVRRAARPLPEVGTHALELSQALEKFKTRLTNTLERGAAENQCVLRTKVTVDAPLFGLQSKSTLPDATATVFALHARAASDFRGRAALIERQMASVAAESLEAFNAHAVEVLSARAKEAGKAPPLPRHPLEPASPLRSPRLTRSGSAAAAAAAGLSPPAVVPAASPLARNQSLGKRRRGGDDEAATEEAPAGAEPAAEAGASLARAPSLRRRVSGPPPAPARKC